LPSVDIYNALKRSMTSLKIHYYVYILFSLSDKKFYTGFTTDLKNRLTEHAQGKVRSTRSRLPVKLIHYEYFINKADAKAREIFLKSGFGRNQMKEALKRTLLKLI
jgi:putative endonuclease